MVRVISQETFDSVVKENMEEFDMSREDAVKEAIEQFQSQVRSWNQTPVTLFVSFLRTKDYSKWLLVCQDHQ